MDRKYGSKRWLKPTLLVTIFWRFHFARRFGTPPLEKYSFIFLWSVVISHYGVFDQSLWGQNAFLKVTREGKWAKNGLISDDYSCMRKMGVSKSTAHMSQIDNNSVWRISKNFTKCIVVVQEVSWIFQDSKTIFLTFWPILNSVLATVCFFPG